MSEVEVLTGSQVGVTAEEAAKILARDWGRNPDSNRWKNAVLERMNRAIRKISATIPRGSVFRVIGADLTVTAGIRDYTVTEDTENGGFGWTNCTRILNIVLSSRDDAPLERIGIEQYRERGELLSSVGPPGSWVEISGTKIRLEPTPDATLTGEGDYLVEMPSLTTMKTRIGGVPKWWDEVLLCGTEYYTARARYKERPSAIRTYKADFFGMLEDVVDWDFTESARPRRAIVTRTMRSRRARPHDNSTDVRW